MKVSRPRFCCFCAHLSYFFCLLCGELELRLPIQLAFVLFACYAVN